MAHFDDPQTQKANLKYIRTAMNQPMLEKEHELDLARRWRDEKDEKALHELINAYARLAISIASRFRNYGLPMGDLIQEGNIGLMQAAEKFDPERDLRFSTYATWWIRAAIQDYVLRNWSIVRTGTTAAHKSLFFNLRRLRAQLGNEKPDTRHLSEKGVKSIASELAVKESDVETMQGRLAANDQSLNAFVGESNETEIQDFLADERPNPEDVVIGMRDAQTRSKWLSTALGELSDRERTIIRERKLNDNVVTLEDLGKDLGISKERVRQLEQKAMDKLRVSLLRQMEETGTEKSSLFS